MDSRRIEKLAQGARESLMEQVRTSLARVLSPESPERLSEPRVVAELASLAANRGEDALVEEVAYTWFNRLCALRFMDARGYTPVGCVTPRPGETMPAILADARGGVFNPAIKISVGDRDQIMALLDGAIGSRDPLGEAYVLLLISVCATYADAMSYLFRGDLAFQHAMRLLAPTDLLSDDSILSKIVKGMDGEACESVEVLGWLYQFYVKERKDEFYASNRKAGKDDIAPATQLFTPNWIVRYLCENSLGRLWMLNNPDSGLQSRMDYYIEPEGDVEDCLKVYGPEEITCVDPACGSGHILVYAFDLLYEMYLEEGYRSVEIPELILKNNLFGFEIDRRAAEIASFALEMKAREKDPSFFGKCIDANITVLESIEFAEGELEGAGLFAESAKLLQLFAHMGEVGSLYVPEPGDAELVDAAIASLSSREGFFARGAIEKLEKMKVIIRGLSRRYSCCVANPPYLGGSALEGWASRWVKDNYPNEKTDLCTCFIKRGFGFAELMGYNAMITMHSWMFLSSYESMRKELIEGKSICTMAHLGAHAFEQIGGEVVQTSATVFRNAMASIAGCYIRLTGEQSSELKRAKLLDAIQKNDADCFYRVQSSTFAVISGNPIAYWASASLIKAFSLTRLADDCATRKGLATSDNNRFLRLWFEVPRSRMTFHCKTNEESLTNGCKWFPHNKGGSFRRWYGNNAYVINWENNGREIRNFRNDDGSLRSRPQNLEFNFLPALTWSKITSGDFSARMCVGGFLFDDAAAICHHPEHEHLCYVLGFLNSPIVSKALEVLNPTLNVQIGDIGNLPLALAQNQTPIAALVEENIALSKSDWDAFELSWDYLKHPLLPHEIDADGEVIIADSIEASFMHWARECEERFARLKANEEELNRIFARIYNMEDEVTIEVPDDKVSVRRADIVRDVKSLVSYGVGCMLGRYSAEKPGLILADAGQTVDDFKTFVSDARFLPDEDNILPILPTEDVSFGDDIVALFKEWLVSIYGQGKLDENVAFIERVLGKDLRTYFVKDFYKDHCNTYQVTGSGKRPIYWLFSSPKGSFNALIYMHRYDRNTVSRVLTDYVRPYRQKLNAQAGVLETSGNARDASRANKYRAMVTELEAWERDVLYPLSQQHVEIDLDDGVRVNYKKFPGALAKVQGLS